MIIFKAKIEYTDYSLQNPVEKIDYMTQNVDDELMSTGKTGLTAIKEKIIQWRRDNGHFINRVRFHGGPDNVWDETNPNIFEDDDNYNT